MPRLLLHLAADDRIAKAMLDMLRGMDDVASANAVVAPGPATDHRHIQVKLRRETAAARVTTAAQALAARLGAGLAVEQDVSG